MAQYDVYPNPLPNARDSVPYVIDVQSALLDQLPTRLVMPLSRVGAGSPRLPLNLCPAVHIEGEALSLMPHQAAPLAARLLKSPVTSLAHRAGEVASAMDAVLSGV
ncbi:MAG: CcdB family protein [Pseudomonadota bacterium]